MMVPRCISKPLAGLAGLFAAVMVAVLAAVPASAQNWPTKPVRVIAASGAGGLSDIYMRAVAERLSKRWGQQVFIENRPGGAFNIGTRACAEAEADGHTICIISNQGVTYNIYLYPDLPFSIEKDIFPITQVFHITQTLAVNADLKVKSVNELIAYAKANPKTLSYTAPAAPLALFLDDLNKAHGIDLVRVPFRGGGTAITGVLSGTTPITFLGIGNMIAHLKSGKMTALMIDGEKRTSLVPDVPTMTELGFDPPLTRSYFGLFAPAGFPKEIANRIVRDIREISAEPEFLDRIYTQRGIEPVLNMPDDFAAFIVKDRANAQRVVKEAGLKPMKK